MSSHSKLTKVTPVVRTALGLLFIGSGLAGLLQLMPPPALEGAGARFVEGLAAAGYLFPLLKLTELVAGVLLVAGVAAPFALTLLAPVVVNVAAFHIFLAPGGMPVVVFLLAAEIYLAWAYRAAFAPLFARAAPAAARRVAGEERAVVAAV